MHPCSGTITSRFFSTLTTIDRTGFSSQSIHWGPGGTWDFGNDPGNGYWGRVDYRGALVEWRAIFLDYERAAPYLTQPEVEAGDALIFTEALIHGTLAWTADHERKALLYKYSPGHSSWAKEYYESGEYVNPTEQLKRIMAAPSVGGRPTPLKFLLDKENRQ